MFAAEFDALRAIILRAPAESSTLGRLIDELAEQDGISAPAELLDAKRSFIDVVKQMFASYLSRP